MWGWYKNHKLPIQFITIQIFIVAGFAFFYFGEKGIGIALLFLWATVLMGIVAYHFIQFVLGVKKEIKEIDDL